MLIRITGRAGRDADDIVVAHAHQFPRREEHDLVGGVIVRLDQQPVRIAIGIGIGVGVDDADADGAIRGAGADHGTRVADGDGRERVATPSKSARRSPDVTSHTRALWPPADASQRPSAEKANEVSGPLSA